MTVVKKTRVKKFSFFIGIDISRNKLDFAVLIGKELLFHQEIANDPVTITTFIKSLKEREGFKISKALFCMEHTGVYGNHLLVVLNKVKAHLSAENPTHIKKSMGMVREKKDKVDAIRIASFAQKNREELRMWEPKNMIIQHLAALSTLRERLLGVSHLLNTPLHEDSLFISRSIQKQNSDACKNSLASVSADLREIDESIVGLIGSDQRLERLKTIIMSVPGVGIVTAVQILITTNGFRDITDPKKFACYAGVAPFRQESGVTTGRKPARLSHFANKKMKRLLHLCAVSASRFDPELKTYFKRKTEQEGKPGMLVLNAIRNKLILRIFACMKQDRCFVKRPDVKEITVGLPVIEPVNEDK